MFHQRVISFSDLRFRCTCKIRQIMHGALLSKVPSVKMPPQSKAMAVMSVVIGRGYRTGRLEQTQEVYLSQQEVGW